MICTPKGCSLCCVGRGRYSRSSSRGKWLLASVFGMLAALLRFEGVLVAAVLWSNTWRNGVEVLHDYALIYSG